ncbi:hypothetical protein [Criblamydia sequanensis]|uniref:Uncharacterized protein n=1 Tax=Candidatus Criblamydia sequanensis CRIB-18 TaxID=1437425 RepID=A0A090DZJ9_9BACT|nr:hypothetical protein [Criblamydia sequanensis]CDR34079.1 hypothetical protein CSEC_1259 [Criblamydia sequanensis CRIB-18]
MINNYPIPIVLGNLRKLSEFKVGDSPVTDISGRLSIENREIFVTLRRAVTHAFDVSVIEKTFADALSIQTTALRHSSGYARKTPYTEKAEIIADLAPAAFKGLQNLAATYRGQEKKIQADKLLEIYKKYQTVIIKKAENKVVRPLPPIPAIRNKPSEIIVQLKNESKRPQPFSNLKQFWEQREVKDSNQEIKSEVKILENAKSFPIKEVETKTSLEKIIENPSEEKKVLPSSLTSHEKEKPLIEKVIINSATLDEPSSSKKEKRNISSLIARIHNDSHQKKVKSLEDRVNNRESIASSQIREITSQEQNKNKPLRSLLQEFFGNRGRPRFHADIIDHMVSVRREKSKEKALKEEKEIQEKGFNIALIEKGKALGTKECKGGKERKKIKQKKKSKTWEDLSSNTYFEENEEKLARQADLFKAVNKQRLTKSISCMIPKFVDSDLQVALQRRRPFLEDSDSDSDEEFDFERGKKSL